MLTNEELKQIRKIVREEIGNESQAIKDDLGAEIRMSRLRIQSNIDGLGNKLKNLEIRLRRMNNENTEDDENDLD